MNEISCKITSSFLKYVRNAKPEFLGPLLEDLSYDEDYLSDPDNWIPWDIERILEERLVNLFNDEMIMFKIGRSVVTLKSLGMVNIVSNLFMTPERLVRYAPRMARYFTKDIVHISVLESGSAGATVELKIKGMQTRGACLFNQGMFSLVSELFGLGPTSVTELQCVVPVDQIGKKSEKYAGVSPDSAGPVMLEGTVFGAHSCIFRLEWRSPGRGLFNRPSDKEKALQDALKHLEENHTKLESAYERLYKSEERYRNLMESASDIICFVDRDGLIRFMNRKGVELTGYSIDELRGRNVLDLVDEEYREFAAYRLRESLDGNVTISEMAIRNRDGDRLILSVNSTLIDMEDGGGLMLIARDITDEKEMATRLIEAEKFAAKGIVAAEIAHEINNSLANIETALFIMNNIKIDRRHRQDVLKDVNEEIERMSGIVKGILEVYRADNSAVQLVDINSEIMKIISIAQRRLQGKGILLVPNLTPGIPPVPCYPGHIKQILLNLIKNAEEAMSLDTSNMIEIVTCEQGEFIRIDINDTGVGISEESLASIGSPLYTSKTEGTGLGLSVCREIAAKYGGSIDIHRLEGKGTGVTVFLGKE
jgi:PAS domain S-box-containing protein